MQDGGPPMACSLLCGSQFGNSLHQRSSPMVLERGKSQIGAHETRGASESGRQRSPHFAVSLLTGQSSSRWWRKGARRLKAPPASTGSSRHIGVQQTETAMEVPQFAGRWTALASPAPPGGAPHSHIKSTTHRIALGPSKSQNTNHQLQKQPLRTGKWPLQSWMFPPGGQAT